MMADGSLFDILHPRYFAAEPTDDQITLKEAIVTGAIFGDVREESKLDFLNFLYRLFIWWGAHNFGYGAISSADAIDAIAAADDVKRFLPNRQIELYRAIFAGLAPGGLLIVADPNGFSSTFNRVNIFTDWRMAVAHFAEWTLVTRWLAEIGFVNVRVIRQMRRKNLGVVEVDVPDDWLVRVRRHEPVDYRSMFGGGMEYEGLEIEDQHLGYIVCAQKPAD